MIKRQLSKFLCVFQAFCIITAAIPAAAAEEVLIDQTSKAVQSLSISVPSFSQIFEGYQQPEAKPVILRNTGESYIYGKVNMSLSGDYFELTQPSGNIALAPGAETDSRNYTVAPKTGLAAGEYTSIITVTYSNEKIGEAVISFTVKPADEEWQEPDPNIPDAKAPQSLAELQNTNPSEVAKLPRFDSRNYGIVPPVKDQGSSNICWCYAPITASEISIHRSGIDTNANTENLRLSPEALARARHSRGADPLGNTKGENTGLDWYSSSGNIDYTPTLLSQWCGPVRTDNAASSDHFANTAYHMENAVNVYTYGVSSTVSREMIKRAIAEYGAVTFSYNNMHEYPFYNPKNETGSGSSPHACTIIGWDDNIPKEKFRPGGASQNGGWLVKNSYDSLPYFWLSYDGAAASSTWAFSYADINKYDFNYFYDSSCDDLYSPVSSAANIFKAKKGSYEEPEALKAVNIGFTGNDVTCRVEIYTDLPDSTSPAFGEPAAIAEASYEYAGYYTITLNEAVNLTNDSYFSVIVTVSNKGNNARVRMANTAANGSSYQVSGGTWKTSLTVPRIKAMTKIVKQSLPDLTPQPIPNAAVDYRNERLINLIPGEVYKINGEDFTAADGKISIQDKWIGKIISVIRMGNGLDTADSDTQSLSIPKRPALPTVSIKNETASGKNDGQINNVNGNIEYQKSGDTAWISCTSDSVINLSPGIYKVRVKANDIAFASEILTVTIAAGTESSSGGNSGSGSSGSGGSSSSSSAKPSQQPSTSTQSAIDVPDWTVSENVMIDEIFTDISKNDWYYEAVQFTYKNGLLRGIEKDRFAPQTAINRAMLVTVLYRMDDLINSEKNADVNRDETYRVFADVPENNYYTDAVKWAVNKKIINGYENGLFLPYKNITREELAVILWRYAGSPAPKNAEDLLYKDIINAPSWSQNALQWAAEEKIIIGRTDAELALHDYATRAEISIIMMRYTNMLKAK